MWHHVFHLIVRPVEFVVGLFSVMTAALLFPTEDGSIQSKLEAIWVRADDWQPGDFKGSFYDLNVAAHEYETLGFDQVSKLLSEDSPRGSEIFEAFGLKIPADQITVWGDVLLLGRTVVFLYLSAATFREV